MPWSFAMMRRHRSFPRRSSACCSRLDKAGLLLDATKTMSSPSSMASFAKLASIRDHDGCFELQLLLLKPMSGLRRVKGKRAKAFPPQDSNVGRAFQG